jgi:HK97 family phage major capsid protein
MNEKLRKLLTQRAAAWDKVKEFDSRAADAKMSPEDDTAYRAALDDTERLSNDIELVERAIRQEAVMGSASANPGDNDTTDRSGAGAKAEDPEATYREAFSSFMRRGLGRLSGDQQRAMQDGYQELEGRALAVATDAAGGYMVPKDFWDKMTESLKAFGGLINEATVLPTGTGADLSWPSNDDTNNTGALLAENVQAGELDFAFATKMLKAHMFTSKITRVSLQLLQDSVFNLDAWLPVKQGERLGRALAPYLINGTGVDQPQGLVPGLAAVTTATVNKITFDDLIDLEHAVNSAYRNRGMYVLADSALRELRKVKDTQGQYIWQPATAAGVPSAINGRPYAIDENMDVFGLGAKPVVFGDIKRAFIVREVAGSQLLRLTERYADFLQVGFLSFARYDSRVDDAAAARALTIKAV